MESKILLEEPSPYGNIFAVVEELGKTITFNLYGPKNIIPLGENPDSWVPMRSCWICNTVPVSDSNEIDMATIVTTMQEGLPPTMPAKHCRHPKAGLQLDKDQLEVVWFEEADCAALLHKGEIMGVIPPWATPSFSDYIGYAKEFNGDLFLGMGSIDEIFPAIEQRIKHAQTFWLRWGQPETWESFLNANMKILESHFGTPKSYYSINEGPFPPKGLAVFEKENKLYFITLGMSILAQPRVELYVQHPEQFRRIELAMAIDKAVLRELPVEKIIQLISSLSSMPWEQLCWFGHGHTLDSGLFTNHILLVDRSLDSIVMPSYEDDPVKLLWLIPISDKEFIYQQEHSSENLINQLEKTQEYWVYKTQLCYDSCL